VCWVKWGGRGRGKILELGLHASSHSYKDRAYPDTYQSPCKKTEQWNPSLFISSLCHRKCPHLPSRPQPTTSPTPHLNIPTPGMAHSNIILSLTVWGCCVCGLVSTRRMDYPSYLSFALSSHPWSISAALEAVRKWVSINEHSQRERERGRV